ncbi:MAG: response regulator transcription factor [Nostocaceae cyanobacterium]|nr:response regulator transcription factor [Nostocaceae cyanobacterium]
MSKIRVALIEDHDLTRVGIRTALQQREEVDVVGEAANATDGLHLVATVHPDIAIVDIGLPDKDGIELTREIKAISESKQENGTKVLILTLRDNRDAVLAAFAAGADSYCMKDISFDNLLEALRVTQGGNAWIDPAIARIVLQQARQTADVAEPVLIDMKTVAINAESPDYDQMLAAYPLTERELEVLQLIVEGCSNAVIAEKLYITVGTVKTHVRNILNKLCADDRTQAAVRALRSGLVG